MEYSILPKKRKKAAGKNRRIGNQAYMPTRHSRKQKYGFPAYTKTQDAGIIWVIPV